MIIPTNETVTSTVQVIEEKASSLAHAFLLTYALDASSALLSFARTSLVWSLKAGRVIGVYYIVPSLVLLVFYTLYCWTRFTKIEKLNNRAKLNLVFPTISVFAILFNTVKRFSIGHGWYWAGKFEKYRQFGADIITINSLFGSTPEFSVANAKAIHRLNLDRQVFKKPTAMYKVLAFFGSNLVIVEDSAHSAEWRLHRKVVAGSFKEKAYPLVWKRTQGILNEMTKAERWDELLPGEFMDVPHIHTMTLRIALVVIAEAGFGLTLPWADHMENQKKDTNSSELTIQQALRTVAENTLIRAVLPKWAFWWPSAKLWKIDRAFVSLEKQMIDLVHKRRELIKRGIDYEDVETFDEYFGEEKVVERVERNDLFGALIKSAMENEEKDVSGQFSDKEVIGNIFIFLLAGHETTANSLAFALANLALHPEAQAELHAEIIEVCGKDGVPTYQDYHRLKYTLSCYNESIRMFPPVNIVPKEAMEDTYLTSCVEGKDSDWQLEEKIFVPKGSKIMIDAVGLHYNPRYWDEPTKFMPERFLKPYNKEAFVPFSGGPRACIGRRFTEVESVCALVNLIRRFEIRPIQNTGETMAKCQERILQAKQVITLSPVNTPLRFVKRA